MLNLIKLKILATKKNLAISYFVYRDIACPKFRSCSSVGGVSANHNITTH